MILTLLTHLKTKPTYIRYDEFVVPLVKAVQEQQVLIKDLLKRIEVLEQK